MARLSIGKSTGTSDKKTSRRLMGAGSGTGSSSAAIGTGRIQTPSLTPRADIVDSFLQTNVPNAPAATDVGSAPFVGAVDPNLERLANELGSLNKNILPTIGAVAKADYLAEQNAKQKAASVIAQHGNAENPEDTLAKISTKLKTDMNNPSLSIQERKGAEKLLGRLDTSGRLQRQIESQSRIRNVQNGALSLSSKAVGATIETTNAQGEPIVVRLDSLDVSDPLYQNWVKENIYGNQYLDSSEYKQLEPIITNAIAQDTARQTKANLNYKVEIYQIDLNDTMDAAGLNLATLGDGAVTSVTIELQQKLDRLRGLLPHLSADAQTKLRAQIPGLLIQNFIKHNRNQSEEVVEKVLMGLMIGPKDSRYITTKEWTTDQEVGDEAVTTTTVNEKQRWVNTLGGENWLAIQMANAKFQLKEADRKNYETDEYNHKETMQERIAKEVAPLMYGPKKNLTLATEKLDEIKNEYLVNSAGKVDAGVQSEVLKEADQIYRNLSKVDSFSVESDILEASKLVAGAKVNVQKNAQLELKLKELEKRYPGNTRVTDFITKTREKTSVYETEEFKQYNKGLEKMIGKIETNWNKYAKTPNSYNEGDTTEEDSMFATGRVKLVNAGEEIILRNLRNGTPGNIAKELEAAITAENAGLIEESQLNWTPKRGSHFEGNSTTALDTIYKTFPSLSLAPGNLKPNDRRELNKQFKLTNKPVFGPAETMEMATLAMTIVKSDGTIDNKKLSKMDPRLQRILKELKIKPGDFFIDQFSKFKGHIRLSEANRQKLLKLNKIKL